MSASLRIGVAEERLEVLPVDIIVVPCASDERPLRGVASRADWRIGGLLSSMLKEGSFQGGAGEAALLAGGVGLVAPRLLVVGQGERTALDSERLEAWGLEALSRCLALSASSVALALLPAKYHALREQCIVFAGAALQACSEVSEPLTGGLDLWLVTLEAERAGLVAALQELAPRLPADIRVLEPGLGGEAVGSAELGDFMQSGGAHQAPSTPYR